MDNELGLISVNFLMLVAATHPPSPATWQAAVHVFLEQFVQSLWELAGAKRTQSSMYQGFVL